MNDEKVKHKDYIGAIRDCLGDSFGNLTDQDGKPNQEFSLVFKRAQTGENNSMDFDQMGNKGPQKADLNVKKSSTRKRNPSDEIDNNNTKDVKPYVDQQAIPQAAQDELHNENGVQTAKNQATQQSESDIRSSDFQTFQAIKKNADNQNKKSVDSQNNMVHDLDEFESANSKNDVENDQHHEDEFFSIAKSRLDDEINSIQKITLDKNNENNFPEYPEDQFFGNFNNQEGPTQSDNVFFGDFNNVPNTSKTNQFDNFGTFNDQNENPPVANNQFGDFFGNTKPQQDHNVSPQENNFSDFNFGGSDNQNFGGFNNQNFEAQSDNNFGGFDNFNNFGITPPQPNNDTKKEFSGDDADINPESVRTDKLLEKNEDLWNTENPNSNRINAKSTDRNNYVHEDSDRNTKKSRKLVHNELDTGVNPEMLKENEVPNIPPETLRRMTSPENKFSINSLDNINTSELELGEQINLEATPVAQWFAENQMLDVKWMGTQNNQLIEFPNLVIDLDGELCGKGNQNDCKNDLGAYNIGGKINEDLVVEFHRASTTKA